MTLQWTESAATQLPILGYVLKMDNGYGFNFTQVYNGMNYPNVLQYTVSGLKTGWSYTFTLQAINFNGLSPSSTQVKFVVCTFPQLLKTPVLQAVTKTTMDLAWVPPQSDGGCPILSYSIWMDDGAGGSFTSVDPATVNNIPELREYLITFPPEDTSLSFKIYL